jgi:hypothetical protein
MDVPPKKIFISATNGDLRTARAVVRKALENVGCFPVEQGHFGPDYRSVWRMLEGTIGDCQAMIHIAGLRYGAEPDQASVPAETPRRSYTQLEYDLGRTLAKERGDKRFRMYTFVCPEGFPYDYAPDRESPERRALQAAHREAIVEGDLTYETPPTLEALQTRVGQEALRFLLEWERDQLRRTSRDRLLRILLAGVVSSVIIVSLAGGVLTRDAIRDLAAHTFDNMFSRGTEGVPLPGAPPAHVVAAASNALARVSKGAVLYNPPAEMTQGIREPISVRVARDQLNADLRKNLAGTGISRVEEIEVSDVMEVNLDGGDAFKVDPESSTSQALKLTGFNEWTFEVTPLLTGHQHLVLSIRAVIILPPYGREPVDNPVLTRNVFVHVNGPYTIREFVKQYGRTAATLSVTSGFGAVVLAWLLGWWRKRPRIGF